MKIDNKIAIGHRRLTATPNQQSYRGWARYDDDAISHGEKRIYRRDCCQRISTDRDIARLRRRRIRML